VLKYAYPIMILGLAGLINELIDRLMLKEILPNDFYQALDINAIQAMGVYSANYKFAIFITLAIQAYRYAAEPFFFKTGKEKNSPQTFSQLMTIFSVILLFAAVVISVFRQEIGILILRQEVYRTGIDVVPILLMANVCVGIYYNLSAWYKLTDKTIFGTIIGFIGAAITIVANYILIPKIGYMGCAYATLICYASMMLISYVFGRKYYPIPYQVGKIVLYFVLSTLIMVLSIQYLEVLQGAIFYKIGVIGLVSFLLLKFEFKRLLKA
jgi:O-antigen/teichoic acid export membrane protein